MEFLVQNGFTPKHGDYLTIYICSTSNIIYIFKKYIISSQNKMWKLNYKVYLVILSDII